MKKLGHWELEPSPPPPPKWKNIFLCTCHCRSVLDIESQSTNTRASTRHVGSSSKGKGHVRTVLVNGPDEEPIHVVLIIIMYTL